MKPRTPIAKISDRRAAERRQYAKARARYLADHPVCELWLYENGWRLIPSCIGLGIAYEFACSAGGMITLWPRDLLSHGAPRSSEIHHRAKSHGKRLLDERWWMAVCRASHDKIENNKSWARSEGYLLPIQSDADGRWGQGNQALTTPELMAAKVRSA